MLKKFNYTISTNTIWTSFDYGQVEAVDYDNAKLLATEKVKKDFDLANEALKSIGFYIECDLSQIELKEI